MLSLKEETGCENIFLELRLVFLKVTSHHGHVLEWIFENFHSGLHSGKVRRDDTLAVWETLLKLLVSTQNTNGSSNEVTNHVLSSGIVESLLEGLHSDIKEESSLILLIDAQKELVEIEFVSKGVEEALVELGLLRLLRVLKIKGLVLLGRSKENVGNSLTALLTKVFVFLGIVVRDGSSYLFSDIDTIVDDVTTNVPGEGDWVLEFLSHL